MYLKNIVIQNCGSIENLKIFENDLFDQNSKPKLVVLLGINGAGKTILLSSIADALYEFANKSFSDDILPKNGLGYSYYKLSGGANQKLNTPYGFCFLQFSEKEKKYEYFDKSGKLSLSDAKEHTNSLLDFASDLKDNENYKGVTNTAEDQIFKSDFYANSYCFFPSDRFEYPHWVNQETTSKNPQFSEKVKFSDRLNKPILIRRSLDEIKSWILDVFLDSRADIEINPDGSAYSNNLENAKILQKSKKNVEEILTAILQKEVELQVTIRGQGSRLKIIDKQTKTDLVPSLDNLSAGQSTLLNMFASIIKLSDQGDVNKSIQLDEIKGIVLIDEIDLHLHINLQKDVLPKLLVKFPNVQFIVSSHSPFFLRGISKEFKENMLLVNMPSGNYLERADDFIEFDKAVEAFTELTNSHKKELDALREEIKEGTKPLVITEGKTDWKHIKKALEKLKTEFNDLDIQFLEYEKLEMGHSALDTMRQEFLKIKQPRPTIFIFDRDSDDILKKHTSREFENWGNNVYSFCIPHPKNRTEKHISIEFYYSDEEIKTFDKEGRRLFLGTEFYKNGNSTDGKYQSIKTNKCGIHKIIDENVYDRNDLESLKSIALSKNDFALNILNNKEGFQNFNVENFKLILLIIKEIIVYSGMSSGHKI